MKSKITKEQKSLAFEMMLYDLSLDVKISHLASDTVIVEITDDINVCIRKFKGKYECVFHSKIEKKTWLKTFGTIREIFETQEND
jgi:hypothetical protein